MVIEIGAGGCAAAATLSVKAFVAICGVLAESFTCAVKLKLPAAPGVPAITPALESDNPPGNCPDAMLQT